MTKIYISTDLGIQSSGGTVAIHELESMKKFASETNDNVIELSFHDIHPTIFGLPDIPLFIDYLALDKLHKIDLSNVDLAHMYGASYLQTIRYLKSKGIKTTNSIMFHNRYTSITEHEKFFGSYPFNYVKDDKLWNLYIGGIKEADICIASGKHPRDNMIKEGAKRIEIIPLGCDIPNEDKIKPFPNEFRCGYLGACVLPESPILTLERGLQKIKDIKIGDKVLTHRGKFKKVSCIMNRQYYGDMIKIIPSNIRTPIILTPEHKVLAVRTSPCISRKNRYDISVCRPDKKCYFTKENGIRYKNCKYIKGEEPFMRYKTEWIESRNLRKGDFVVYPKADEIIQDIEKINVFDWIDDVLNITTDYDGSTKQYDIFGNIVQDTISMDAPYSKKYANIPVEIELTKDLMRLFGYFIAEGDIPEGRKIRFSFNINEVQYHRDVENIMKDIFGVEAEHYINSETNIHRLSYSNNILGNMFQNMFAPSELQTKKGPGCKANIVRIPSEFLNLPLDKLAELVKGEWRGDGSDYAKTNQYNITTTSETLAHQLIYILSKFGILASLKTTKSKIEGHENKYDVIISSGDDKIFENIIGEKINNSDVYNYSQTYLKGKKLFYIQIRDIDIINYNGNVWNLEVEEDNSYVSYIALHNCGPDKGLYYLIKSWELLNYQDGSKLIFAGPNSEQILPNFIRQHAKTGKFHLMGYINNIADFYNNISIYVQPSATEGFCILPDSPILTLDRGVQKIKDINIGDKVLTHKGRFMRVSQLTKREFNGDMIKIIPHNIRVPIFLTPEHRILGVKTELCYRNSRKNIFSICRYDNQCYYMYNGRRYKHCKYLKGYEPFNNYKTEWIEARCLEKGDFVTYPKVQEKETDIKTLRIIDYIDDIINITGDSYDDNSKQTNIFGDIIEKTITINSGGESYRGEIPAEIELTRDLMRLFGYFIAEGDIAGDRQIEICFNINENEYINDAEKLMRNIFGLDAEHIIKKGGKNTHTLRYSNKILSNMFQNMFCPKEYVTKKGKGSKANIVRIPPEFLNLPLNKLAELIKGEWRGDGSDSERDANYSITTTSETLVYQLQYILSKFNILASIQISKTNNEKWHDKYILIISGKDIEIFNKIIAENIITNSNSQLQKYLKGKNLFYIQIRDVEIVHHDGEVFNLEIEEDKSYVSSIVLHNCLEIPEAMSYGRPCICTDGAGAADCITHGEDGFVIPSKNPEEIADKIQYFKDNPKEIERMGKNARTKSLTYSWKNTKQKYVNLWRSLL